MVKAKVRRKPKSVAICLKLDEYTDGDGKTGSEIQVACYKDMEEAYSKVIKDIRSIRAKINVVTIDHNMWPNNEWFKKPALTYTDTDDNSTHFISYFCKRADDGKFETMLSFKPMK